MKVFRSITHKLLYDDIDNCTASAHFTILAEVELINSLFLPTCSLPFAPMLIYILL